MKYALLLMGILFATPLLSQVGINNTNPNATLEINASNVGTPSNEDGILIPRVDEFPVTDPGAAQDGMMVFITGNGTPAKGFYYWDNDAVSWISVNGDKNTLDEGYDEGGAGVGRIITADNGALEIQDTGGLRVEGDINAAANIVHDGDTNTFITFTPDRFQVDAGGRNYIDIQHSNTEVTFNEDSTQSDFRVESGNQEYMLFVDGSNDAIGIGQNNPQSPLHVGIQTTWDLSYANTGQDGLYLRGSGDNSGQNAIGSSIGFGPPHPTRADQRKAAIASVQTSGDVDHLGLAFYIHANAINMSDMVEAMRITRTGLGVNNSSPDATLDVVGTMQFVDGNEAAGYVLASDATGNATWTDPSGLVSDTQNTLDAAYDEGGAGVGSTITADTGAVTINGDDGFTVSGTFSSGDAVNITGAGTRMFFNPRTSAFRAGSVAGTEWDPGNLGNFSVAIGRENIASGVYSTAFGYQNTASTEYTFTTGFSNVASGASSIAMGYDNTASGIYSFSAGRESSATGDYGISLGYDANATGNLSIALGRLANANVTYATAIGFTTTASGVSSLAMGDNTVASGSYSGAFGRSTIASGNSATAMGLGTQAYSFSETVVGLYNTAYSPTSTSAFSNNDRLFVVGNGTDNSNRSNALTIFKNGEVNINDAYSLPTADGTSGQVLTTDGSGTLSFATAPSDTDWVDSGGNIERQSGDVYIGDTNATNNDLYISDRIIDWDNSSFYVDPASTSNFNNINVDASSETTPSIQINDTNTGLFSGTVGTIGVTTNGTERMRIQDDGELSIGLTTATNYKLAINSLSNTNQIRVGNDLFSENVVDINHGGQQGNSLDISVNSLYTLASRSGISVFNDVGDTQVDIGKYDSGTINFYGLEVSIPVNGSGVEYGVYSDVQTVNGFAGYFLGDVSIGTTSSDNYILPASRGTNGQIMETDGSGNVSWVTPSSSVTASNGLSASGGNVTLGGALTADTTISQGNFDINFDLTTSSGVFSVDTSALVVENTGDVGIGITTPSYDLDVIGIESTDYIANFYNNVASGDEDGIAIRLRGGSNANNYYAGFYRANGTIIAGAIRSNGAGGVVYASLSDRRLKTNIIDFSNALEKLEKLKPRIYEYKEFPGKKEIGFIAQELKEVFPQVVSGNPNNDVTKNPMMVDYGRLTPLLTASIQELNKKVEALSEENQRLKEQLSKYESLEARLSALESNNSTKEPNSEITSEKKK